jgi:ATP-binding cassette, subfamily B, bacterial
MRRRRRPRLVRQLMEMRGVGALLGPYLRAHRRALWGGLGLTLILLLFRLAQPWPLKWIVDGLVDVGPQPVGPLAASMVFLVVAGGAALLEYAQVLTLVGIGNRVLHAFRADLFRHVLKQPLAFHERKVEGELLTRIVYDTTRLRKGLNNVLTRVVQTVLLFGAIVGVLFWVDAALASVMAVAGVVALFVMARGGERVRRAARKNRRREGRLAGLVAEDLMAIREVQAFMRESQGESFDRLNAKALKEESKVRRLASGMLLRVEVVVGLGIAVVLLAGAARVATGALSPGELVLFVAYATALYPPFFRFARQAARMGTTLASAERLKRLMLREPAIVDAPDAVEAGPFRGAIELSGVGVKNARRRRGSRKWALRDVDLAIEPGERVALVGPNGAGKSSLLRLLIRLADPDRGVIRIDGAPARTYTLRSLRGQLSIVLQGTVLFGLTVRENLTLGNPDATDAQILDALARANALELIQRLPDGIETVVRRHGRLFSTGERQRIAIARALLRDGAIWLLDEPTSGLDGKVAAETTAVLEQATRGRTTLWITHDPRMPPLLDRVVLLTRGRVHFTGRPHEYHIPDAETALTLDPHAARRDPLRAAAPARENLR